MFCAQCQSSRPDNAAPCLRCGAPSSSKGQENSWGKAASAWSSWSASDTSFSDQQWGQNPQGPSWGAQSSSSWSTGQAWQQNSAPSQAQSAPPSTWQTAFESAQDPAQNAPEAKQSMLPVPYQPPVNNAPGMMLQVMSPQHIEHLLPAIPEEAGTIFVPPMYTKPRPIIPKYRVISGLISFIVVTFLLCGGATYYGNASGKFDPIKRFVTNSPPPAIAQHQKEIPDPLNRVDKGPAYNIISSATTTLKIDPDKKIALQPQKVFKPGDQFYITYGVQPQGKKGTVTVKIYTDNNLYQPLKESIDGTNRNGYVSLGFTVPTSGSVEFYWNDQFAQRIYFAVR